MQVPQLSSGAGARKLSGRSVPGLWVCLRRAVAAVQGLALTEARRRPWPALENKLPTGAGIRRAFGFPSDSRQYDALLRLIFALLVLVRSFANLVGLEKHNLAQSFVRIYTRGQWRGVRDFECHKPFPFRLQRRHIHDNATTGVGRFPHADGQDV